MFQLNATIHLKNKTGRLVACHSTTAMVVKPPKHQSQAAADVSSMES